MTKGSKSLLIVSDSMMWNLNGETHVFEPTLREVEYLTQIFDEITWIGFGQNLPVNKNARATAKNIRFVLLQKSGGSGLFDKMSILGKLPYYLKTILKYRKQVSYVHTRGPSVPALITVLLSFIDKNRTYWHKFAGNWIEENPPKSYAIQRFLLKKATNTKVTINGAWNGQQKHVISFENPTISNSELEKAELIAKNRSLKLSEI